MLKAYVTFAALALALSGCGARVVVDETSSNSTDPTDGGGGGSGGPIDGGVAKPNAVAMRFSQWTPPSDSSPHFQFLLGVTPDPNAVMLFYADKAQACAQPHIDVPDLGADPAACPQLAFWQVILIIPPELAHVGVIELLDPSVVTYWATLDKGCNGALASGVGGFSGKLTITSIDATEVVAKLDLDPNPGFHVKNGDYTAAFCP